MQKKVWVQAEGETANGTRGAKAGKGGEGGKIVTTCSLHHPAEPRQSGASVGNLLSQLMYLIVEIQSSPPPLPEGQGGIILTSRSEPSLQPRCKRQRADALRIPLRHGSRPSSGSHPAHGSPDLTAAAFPSRDGPLPLAYARSNQNDSASPRACQRRLLFFGKAG